MIVELLPLFITLLIAGALAGITAGLFGNGGGFVVVPALVFVFSILADPTSDLIFVAIGTSLATIVISSARSVIAHRARGAVDFDVVKSWAPWLLLGVGVGLYLHLSLGRISYILYSLGEYWFIPFTSSFRRPSQT